MLKGKFSKLDTHLSPEKDEGKRRGKIPKLITLLLHK